MYYLKNLEVAGFKSFAKKTKLEFKTPITAIVGPNGSGKSNIAEAFRFVLGEQRMTQMRSKKTEDLIWNGSQTVSRSRHATVTLAFDNKEYATQEHNRERLFDIDFDEVTLKRVIHRDASTEYHLNGSTVRLKDIVELLSAAHMGSSGHHIISQGETDRILLVNARERKEIVEDALGLKIFQYKKQEAIRKLERTEQHKKEIQSLRREIVPHLKFLESQVEKVEKAHSMRKELLGLYHMYFSAEKIRINNATERLENQKVPLEKKLITTQKGLEKAKSILADLADYDEYSKKLYILEQELSNIRKTKNTLTRELGQLEGELRALSLVNSEQNHTVSSEDVVHLKNAIEEKCREADGSADVVFLQNIIHMIQTQLHDFVKSFITNQENTETLHQEKQSEKHTKESELNTIMKKEETLNISYATLRKRIEADKDSSRDAERAVFKLSSEDRDLQSNIDFLLRDEEVLKRDKEDLENERSEAVVLIGRNALDEPNSDKLYVFDSDVEREAMKKNIERLKIRLEDTGTDSGNEVVEEYEEIKEREAFLERELSDLDKSREKLQILIGDLEQRLSVLFKEGVEAVNINFQKLFSVMFGGGSAKLELVQEQDESIQEDKVVYEEGLSISVNLPRKKIRGLHMLSGGERALTSIALLFAMSQVNPPPFLLLDETDAALDEANSKRYGDMIEKLSRESQLIVITHNRETMSRAGVLYGVTMGRDGVSQLLSVNFDEAVKVAK